MTRNVKSILLTDGYKKKQIYSVPRDTLFLFALYKCGYFPSEVSTTSARSCAITCLICQEQKSFFLPPSLIQAITFVSAGFPF